MTVTIQHVMQDNRMSRSRATVVANRQKGTCPARRRIAMLLSPRPVRLATPKLQTKRPLNISSDKEQRNFASTNKRASKRICMPSQVDASVAPWAHHERSKRRPSRTTECTSPQLWQLTKQTVESSSGEDDERC